MYPNWFQETDCKSVALPMLVRIQPSAFSIILGQSLDDSICISYVMVALEAHDLSVLVQLQPDTAI